MSWRLFEKTGNVEAYLLAKQLEMEKVKQTQPSSSPQSSKLKPNV
ncbi:hypothetical protein ABID56_000526 [Alkalibacillus flavidus]|uniref:YqzL family protein n=1 Tax=Alkalibacillus flavidus TaxID=546021 RepID=A0ABV2KSB3_9BACI